MTLKDNHTVMKLVSMLCNLSEPSGGISPIPFHSTNSLFAFERKYCGARGISNNARPSSLFACMPMQRTVDKRAVSNADKI